MDSQVQILQVTVRNTRSGRPVYDVACGDGVTRQVWDGGLANALNALAGQTVLIREKVEQKGQYTNHTILTFAQPGQALPPDTAALAPVQGLATPLAGGPVVTVSPQGPVVPIAPSPIQPSQGGGGGYTPDVTKRITKLAAYDHAATFVGSLFSGAGPEAFDQALGLVHQAAQAIYKAARSHENAPAQQVAPQEAPHPVETAMTPQEIAAAVPGVTVGAPVAVAQDAAAEAGDVIEWD